MRELNLSGNSNLRSLPRGVCELARLEKLNLSGTGLELLLGEIGDLRALTWLGLAEMRWLKFLPVEIGRLTRLQTLDLSGTGLRLLPDSVEKLRDSITDLKLSGIHCLNANRTENMLGWLALWNIFRERVRLPKNCTGLMDGRELDAVLEQLLEDGDAWGLKELLQIGGAWMRDLLCKKLLPTGGCRKYPAERFGYEVERGVLTLIKRRSVCGLLGFLKEVPVARMVLSCGESNNALRWWLRELKKNGDMRTRNRLIDVMNRTEPNLSGMQLEAGPCEIHVLSSRPSFGLQGQLEAN